MHRSTGRGPGTAAAAAAEIVGTVLADVRRGAPASGVVPPRLGRVDDPVLRGAVMTQLRAALASALTAAWRRGWQPAELVHAARRSLCAAEVDALVDGLRAQLATYPRSTVDPRWWEQLEELAEDGDADGRRGHRRARRRGRPARATADTVATWLQEFVDVLSATVCVEHLPQLQVLGPLPGEVRHPDAEAPPDVDDKLLTKVRRLLAQAEGTPYEAEAETFTAAAQSLMARHRIDRAMLEATDEQAHRGPGAVRLAVDRPYEQPKMLLLSVVAAANRCRALWNQSVGFATVVGHGADRRAVELLFTSLLVQATTAMQREGERHGGRTRTRGFRSSFLSGFAARIGQRLEEASHAAEGEAVASLAGREGAPSGPAAASVRTHRDGMALVLRRRDEAVEELVRELFPHTVRTRSRTISDRAGWVQGTVAADRANLGVGGRLAGGAS